MKYFTLFILILLTSCISNKEENNTNNATLTRILKLRNYTSDFYNNDNSNFEREKLIGEWKYSKSWCHIDSGWTDYRFLDITLNYNFYLNNRYIHLELDSNGHVTHKENGEYLIDSLNNISLIYSMHGDSIISEGDTCLSKSRTIFLINDSTLIWELNYGSTSYDFNDFEEYRKEITKPKSNINMIR